VISLETDNDGEYDEMSGQGEDSGSVQSASWNGSDYVSERIGSSPDHQNLLYHPYQPHKQQGRMMRRASSSNNMYSTRPKYKASPTIQKRVGSSKNSFQHLPYAPLIV
ncbi:MAG: hypothetical protein ACI8RD_009001, partial [Bacillariaceae sp.]|jgi:hypothetical protein